MAQRPQPIIVGLGISAVVLTIALILAPPLRLLTFANNGGQLSAADGAAIRFTVLQAMLSATLSVFLAIPVARALARRNFPGRGILITLLGAPFLLPVIVAILGILAVWGRSGWISSAMVAVGGQPISIYGLTGILIAHVFFNLPLATRLILQGWTQIPAEHFRLAAQVGLRPWDMFRHLEWPMLRGVIPGAFLVVFLLCVTSFAVALTLGGGPRATTIELAIYEAVRFDFDLSRAAILSLIQFALCAVVAVVTLKINLSGGFGGGLGAVQKRWDVAGSISRRLDFIYIGGAMIFLVTPLLAVLLRGFVGFAQIPNLTNAIFYSLIVALGSAGFAIGLALALALWIDRLRAARNRLAVVSEVIGIITLAASPFVLGTGLFLIIREFANPFSFALPVTALVNAMIALPIALRVLLPVLERSRITDGRLAESLSLSGWSKFRHVTWPLLKPPLGFAVGVSAALSMGDLGVITLFAPPNVETLPLLMYRLIGGYQMEAAASVALVLVSLTLAVFWVFDRGGRLGHKH